MFCGQKNQSIKQIQDCTKLKKTHAHTHTHTHTHIFLVVQMVKNLPAMQGTQAQSLGQEDPLEKGWQPTAMFLLGNPMDRRAWRATVHGAAEMDTTEQLSMRPCAHTHTHTHTQIYIYI